MISEEIKNKIIFLVENTHFKYSKIYEEVAQNEEFEIDVIFEVLTEYEQKIGKKIKRPKKIIKELYYEELFNLREEGLTYDEISEYLSAKVGINISRNMVRYLVKEIYKSKGLDIPKAKSNLRRIKIDEEKIYELREEGYSYEEIANYFRNEGIDLNSHTIDIRCKQIYKSKGKEEPKAKWKKKNEISDSTKEKIYELRKKGYTYKKISEYLAEQGIVIAIERICFICRIMFVERGEKEPVVKKNTKRVNVDVDEILKLREQGFSYKKISEYFKQRGTTISIETVRKRCIEVCDSQKLKYNCEITSEELDNKIFELREEGIAYARIADMLKKQGIRISVLDVKKRCIKVYMEKGKKEPKTKQKKRSNIEDEEIYVLRKQKLSYSEISKRFQAQGIKISTEVIRKRCKIIFESKQEIEPKIKTGKKIEAKDEEIYELRKLGLSFQKISDYFLDKGITINFQTVRKRYMIYKEKLQVQASEKDRKEISLRSVNKDVLKRKILELKVSRNATDEQLSMIAKLYGVDLKDINDDFNL